MVKHNECHIILWKAIRPQSQQAVMAESDTGAIRNVCLLTGWMASLRVPSVLSVQPSPRSLEYDLPVILSGYSLEKIHGVGVRPTPFQLG